MKGSKIELTDVSQNVYDGKEWIYNNITRENVNNVVCKGKSLLSYVYIFHEEIPYLLKMGADPNVFNHMFNSPLMQVCVNCDMDADIVLLLLDYGADIHYMNCNGHTALYVTLFEYHDTLSSYKIGKEQCDRYMRKIRLLLDRGAIINDAWEIEQAVKDFIEMRNQCRKTALLVCGIGKRLLGNKNVATLVGKHIWSMRIK